MAPLHQVDPERDSFGEVDIKREVLSEELLRQKYKQLERDVKEPYNCKARLIRLFCPFLISLKGYNFQLLLRDVIAGLTVACIRLPQGLAYGALASIPPIHGLYTELFSCLIYSLFATSRQNSVGTFAVVALMTGSMVDEYIPVDMLKLADNSTELIAIKTKYIYSATTLIGCMQVLFGLFQLGKLSILLPPLIVNAFTTGAAFYVLTSQVKVMLGLGPDHVPRNMRTGGLFITWAHIVTEAQYSIVPAVIISVSCIVFLIIIKECQIRFQDKLKGLPLPGELMVVAVCTILGSFVPSIRRLVPTVGEIPKGLPRPSLPDVSLWPRLIAPSFPIAIVSYTTTLSLGKKFADINDYTIDAEQEAYSIGLGNVFGGLFGAIPAAASLSRSALQHASGGQTQVTSIISSVILLLVLLVLGPYFSVLPRASLAAIITVNLRGMFRQFTTIPSLFRFSRLDTLVWLTGFGSVLSLGIELGLLSCVFALLLSNVLRLDRTRIQRKGRVSTSELYRCITTAQKEFTTNEAGKVAETLLGVFYIPTSLNFVTAQRFMSDLPRSGHVIIDCSAISHMDATGRRFLVEYLETPDLTVSLCALTDEFYHQIKQEQLNWSKVYVMASVHDGVLFHQKNRKLFDKECVVHTNTSFIED